MSKTAAPTSWRALDAGNVAHEYECVIIPQMSHRRRYYEVLTYGIHFGHYPRLEEAKAGIEEIYGPVNWTRVRLPLVEVEHYYFGKTTEFTDPLLVYAADLPRLGVTAAKFLPEGVRIDPVIEDEHREDGHIRLLWARDTDGGTVGYIAWYEGGSNDGKIEMVDVEEEWQRQGIATALWNEAKRIKPNLRHDPDTQSPEGAAWAKAMGGEYNPRIAAKALHHQVEQFRSPEAQWRSAVISALADQQREANLGTRVGATASAAISEADRRKFTLGQCGPLAVALHDATGWPIAVVADGEGEGGLPSWSHAGVVAPDGRFLDVEGFHTEDEVIRRWQFDDDSEPGDYWLTQVDADAFRAKSLPDGVSVSEDLPRVLDAVLAAYVPGSRRTSSLGTRLWWRVHPEHREFMPEMATSAPFFEDGSAKPFSGAPAVGYSCFKNPWHLWLYIWLMWGWEGQPPVIGFTGQEVGEGHDGESLVVPDGGTVLRYANRDFFAELMDTPFPPSPVFAPWAAGSMPGGHMRSWETLAARLAWLDQGDPVQEHIVRTFAPQQAVASYSWEEEKARLDAPRSTPSFTGTVREMTDDEVEDHFYIRPIQGVLALQDGEEIGWLTWNPSNQSKIEEVQVQPGWRRKGVGRALLAKARQIDPAVTHSETLTDDGAAWSQAVAKTAMPVGPPPPGLRYLITWNNIGRVPATRAYCILGAVLGGEVVGYLTWGIQGRKVQSIWVKPEHRRRRIAETMFDLARTQDPGIVHHPDRTDSGEAWVRSISPEEAERINNTTEEDSDKEAAGWTLTDRLLNPRFSDEVKDLTPMAAMAAKTAGLTIEEEWDLPNLLPRERVVTATLDGKRIGWLVWEEDTHLINMVQVLPAHRRQGLATRLLEAARALDPAIKHDTANLTDEGRAWSQAVGSKTALTLYRGEGSHERPSYYTQQSNEAGAWWTTDLASAQQYAKSTLDGKVYVIEVDGSEVERRGLPQYRFIPDPEVRKRRRLYTGSKTAAYDGTLIARGLTVGTEGDDKVLAQKLLAGTVTVQDMIHLLERHDGRVGIWWGVMGTYGDLSDFEDHAFASEDLLLVNYIEPDEDWWGGEVQVVLVAKRPTRDGQPWDPEEHNPPEAGGLMGNSYLADSEQVELVEVRYNAGLGWKSLPAQGIRVTARKTAANGVWYHASPVKMEPGTALKAAETPRFTYQVPGKVYFTPDPWVALNHVQGITKVLDGKAWLYRVEPVGDIQDDPEALEFGYLGAAYMADDAVVVERYGVDSADTLRRIVEMPQQSYLPRAAQRTAATTNLWWRCHPRRAMWREAADRSRGMDYETLWSANEPDLQIVGNKSPFIGGDWSGYTILARTRLSYADALNPVPVVNDLMTEAQQQVTEGMTMLYLIASGRGREGLAGGYVYWVVGEMPVGGRQFQPTNVSIPGAYGKVAQPSPRLMHAMMYSSGEETRKWIGENLAGVVVDDSMFADLAQTVTVYRGISLAPGEDPLSATKGEGWDLGSSWTTDPTTAKAIAERGKAGFSSGGQLLGDTYGVDPERAYLPTVLRAEVTLMPPEQGGPAPYRPWTIDYASEAEIDIPQGTEVVLNGIMQATKVVHGLDPNPYARPNQELVTFTWPSSWRSVNVRRQAAYDYQGGHMAPTGADDVAAPLHDVEDMMPDYYTRPSLYSHDRGPVDRECAQVILAARGNPEARVTIYRALPSAYTTINPGDWVTISETYARGHAMQSNDPSEDWPVIAAEVPASTLWTEGYNAEWGYSGPEIAGRVL